MQEREENLEMAVEALLGNLEGEDRLRAEETLRALAEDKQALRAVSETLADLACIAPSVPAPPALKQRLIRSIAKPVPLPMEDKPQPGRSAWVAPLGYAAAAVLAVSTAYLATEHGKLDDTLTSLRAQNGNLAQTVSQQQRALGLVGQPGVKEVILDTKQDQPRLRAFWSDDEGLVLVASNLAPLPGDRVLQLWVIPAQGSPISAGSFRPNEDGSVLYFHRPSNSTAVSQALAITNEPSPGSPQPTSTPIWVGSL